jgi:hypothetical protein
LKEVNELQSAIQKEKDDKKVKKKQAREAAWLVI